MRKGRLACLVWPARHPTRTVGEEQRHSGRCGADAPGSGFGGPGQRLVDRQRIRHPVGKTGHHLIGSGAAAVDEPVRDPLGPLAHGLKGDRDHGGSDDGQQQVRPGAAAQRGADADDDSNVDDGDEGGERAVDQGTVDHHVDVIKAVTKHRNRDADGQQRDRQPSRGLGHDVWHVALQNERDYGDHHRHQEPTELLPLAAITSPVANYDRGNRSNHRGQAKQQRDVDQDLEHRFELGQRQRV